MGDFPEVKQSELDRNIFFVKAMTFQQYLLVLLLLSKPQPKMFCDICYTTKITHSHSL